LNVRRTAVVKVSRQGPSRKSRLVAGAALSALLLTSCAGNTPGVAAEVEGDRITDEQVDDFARVLCALGALPGGEAGAPTKTARYSSLRILLDNELAADIADLEAVDRASVAGAVEELSASRDSIPADVRDTFDEVAEEFSRAQGAIIALGRQSLEEAGQQGEIDDQAAYTEGQRLRTEYAAQADIEVDSRFGTLKEGVLQPGDGSLSVPVSELAVQAGAAEPSAALIEQLPASQKCA
jgi:hypothetical protein